MGGEGKEEEGSGGKRREGKRKEREGRGPPPLTRIPGSAPDTGRLH